LSEGRFSSLELKSKWFFFFRRMIEFHTFLRLILTNRVIITPNAKYFCMSFTVAMANSRTVTSVMVQQVGHSISFPSIKHALSTRHRQTTNSTTTPSRCIEPSINSYKFTMITTFCPRGQSLHTRQCVYISSFRWYSLKCSRHENRKSHIIWFFWTKCSSRYSYCYTWFDSFDKSSQWQVSNKQKKEIKHCDRCLGSRVRYNWWRIT